MIQIILFIAFIVFNIYTIYKDYPVNDPSKNFIENYIDLPLSQKIVIPKGLEKEYNYILTYGHLPYQIIKHRPTPQHKTSHNQVFQQNSTIKLKIYNYMIKENSFIASIILYNSSNNEINQNINIKCQLNDADNKITDLASWTGHIDLKPKKGILIKDINFGFTPVIHLNNVQCIVAPL